MHFHGKMRTFPLNASIFSMGRKQEEIGALEI